MGIRHGMILCSSIKISWKLNSGIKIPFTTSDGFYTIKFKYKSEQPFNLRLLKSSNNTDEVIGFHYKTGIPASIR